MAEASEGEGIYSNDGEPSGHEYDRRNFKAIRAISRTVLEDMVLDLVDPEEELPLGSCRVTQRKEGSFHHAVSLTIERDDQIAQEYVLKIPAHGTPKEWNADDIMMLEVEAQMMQHIRHHTDWPVPDVIAYDGSLGNAIGAPYILMKKMEGISAVDIWLGQPYKTIKDAELHLNADDPSPELEKKRITFLRSLAQAMSQLAPLEFEYTGFPIFHDPKGVQPEYITPVWRWHSKTVMEKPMSGGSFETGEAFFAAGLDKVCKAERDISPGSDGRATNGVWIVMNIVLSSAPFKPSAPSHGGTPSSEHDSNGAAIRETFVLRHDDLDLQNILVDSDGNVTGIIDWDGCAAVPRCLGYISTPTFLRRDWLPDYTIARLPHMTWALERYRNVYAEAMDAFCESLDAKYTRKSAMYQLVLAALDKDVACMEVVEMLLREIPEFRRVDVKMFCRRLGQGWPAAEEALKVKIAELLKPE
jgi:serine/threonine protein kinase